MQDHDSFTFFPTKRIEVNPILSLFPESEGKSLSSFLGNAKAQVEVPLGPKPIKRRIIVLGNKDVIAPYLFALASKAEAYNLSVIAYCDGFYPKEFSDIGVRTYSELDESDEIPLPTFAFLFKKDSRFSISDLISFSEPYASRLVCFGIDTESSSTTQDFYHKDFAEKTSEQIKACDGDGFNFWTRMGSEYKGSPDLSQNSIKPTLGGYILDNMAMALMDSCFQDDFYDKDLYLDTGSTSLSFIECAKVVLSTLVSVSRIRANCSIGGELSALGKLKAPLSEKRFSDFSPNIETNVPLSEFMGKTYFGAFLTQDEVLSKAKEIKELGLKLDKAIFVINDPCLLSFYEDALSSYLGFKVSIISPLSAFPCVNFSYKKEEAIRRTLAHRHLVSTSELSTFSYPMSEDALWNYYLADYRLYVYDWRNYEPIFSRIPFFESLKKKGGDIATSFFLKEDQYIAEKLTLGERIKPLALYCAVYPLYLNKKYLLWELANYEHIAWGRRTLLYNPVYKDKASSLVSLGNLCDKVNPSGYQKNVDPYRLKNLISEDIIWLDFGTILDFLSVICASFKSGNILYPIREMNAKPIEKALVSEDKELALTEGGYSEKEVTSFYLNHPDFDFGKPNEVKLLKEPTLKLPSIDKVCATYYVLPLSYLKQMPRIGEVLNVAKYHLLVLDSCKVNSASFLRASIAADEYEEDDVGSSFSAFLSRSYSPSESPFVLLRVLVLPTGEEEISSEDIGAILSLPQGANLLPKSPTLALMKIRLLKKYNLGELGLKIIKKKLVEPLTIAEAPFIEVLDPSCVTSYHLSMAHYYEDYKEVGLNLTSTLSDISRAIEPLKEDYPYTKEMAYIGATFPSTVERLAHVMLPFNVPDYTFTHLVSLLFKVSEEDAVDILNGTLLLNEKELKEGRLVLGKGEGHVSFFDSFDNLLYILKGQKGDLYEESLSSFAAYPYGEEAERLLFLRFAKLGLVNKNTFYHNALPVTSKLKNDILAKSPYLGTYGESLLLTLQSVKYYEDNGSEDEELKEDVIKYANECFKTHYFAHYIYTFYGNSDSSCVGPSNKRFAGVLREVLSLNKKEALSYILSLMERVPLLLSKKQSSLRKGEYILMAGLLELSSNSETRSLCLEAAKMNKYFLSNVSAGEEAQYFGLRSTLFYLNNRTDFTLEKAYDKRYLSSALEQKVDPPIEVELKPFEEVDSLTFLIKETFFYRRTLYYLLYPKVDQSWIKKDEFLFAYKKSNADDQYYIVTNKTELETVFKAAINIIKGATDDEDDDDDDF